MSSIAGLPPTRVLLVHNRYQQRGGEDGVFEAEAQLLRAHGHDVQTYVRTNDDLKDMSRADAALQSLWSRRTLSEVGQLIASTRPDVIHVHNTLSLVSPSVYYAAARARVPVVQTLHNFRLMCPGALMLRDGQVCTDCRGHLPWRAVRHACYRGSRLQTAAVAGVVSLHGGLGTWRRRVTRYIALNEFCREQFILGGLPADRIRVKPNFADLPAPPDSGERRGLLFVGRLAVEKGAGVIASAYRDHADLPPITIAGDGPDAAVLDGIAGVNRLGSVPGAQVPALMASASALVLPSIWYEAFPRTIVEAFACGLPVIASRIGALPSLVAHERTGLLFEPGNPQDLARVLKWAGENPEQLAEMGRAARRHYEAHLTGAANYPLLMDIYKDAQRALAST